MSCNLVMTFRQKLPCGGVFRYFVLYQLLRFKMQCGLVDGFYKVFTLFSILKIIADCQKERLETNPFISINKNQIQYLVGKMSEKEYDLIIIGAGPAGLAAGIYGGRSGLNTLILDEEMAGGTVAEAPEIDNYPGLEEISGMELADRMSDHVAKYAELNEGFSVEDVDKNEDQIIVRGIDRDYESKAVIIANGCDYSKLDIPGEERLKGRGVSYCATCDGSAVKGESVLVVGGGNSAFSNALYLLDLGCDVTLIHKRDEFRAEEALRKSYLEKGGDIMRNYVLEEVVGDDVVESVKLRSLDDDVAENLLVKAVFISVGEDPRKR